MLNPSSGTFKYVQTCLLLASVCLAWVSKEIHPPVESLLGVSYLIIASPWDTSQASPGMVCV